MAWHGTKRETNYVLRDCLFFLPRCLSPLSISCGVKHGEASRGWVSHSAQSEAKDRDSKRCCAPVTPPSCTCCHAHHTNFTWLKKVQVSISAQV